MHGTRPQFWSRLYLEQSSSSSSSSTNTSWNLEGGYRGVALVRLRCYPLACMREGTCFFWPLLNLPLEQVSRHGIATLVVLGLTDSSSSLLRLLLRWNLLHTRRGISGKQGWRPTPILHSRHRR